MWDANGALETVLFVLQAWLLAALVVVLIMVIGGLFK